MNEKRLPHNLKLRDKGETHNDKISYDKKRDEFLQSLGLNIIHVLDIDIKEI